jgi:cell division protein FtsW
MRKHRPDLLIGVLAAILALIGLIVIYAIGPGWANFRNSVYGTDYSENYYFMKQLVSVAVGVVVFVIFYKMPVKFVKKYGWVALVLGILGSLVLFIVEKATAGEGNAAVQCALGACRWFKIPGFGTFQPAELLKAGIVFYFSAILARRAKEGQVNSPASFVPIVLVFVVSMVFVVMDQKDMGTGLTILAIMAAIIVASGVKLRVLALIGLLVVGAFGLAMASPHRVERIRTFLGGGSEAGNYHIDNALTAIGAGGLFGVGIGNSVQALGYLPESINDSVFAVMGETFGFVGLTIVILLFFVLIWRILRVAERLRDRQEMLIVVGIFGWIASHVIINIAAMTGIVPLTGITLPLLSAGGTSIVFVAMILGVVVQLSRGTEREKIKEREDHEDLGRRRGIGGAHYAGTRGDT